MQNRLFSHRKWNPHPPDSAESGPRVGGFHLQPFRNSCPISVDVTRLPLQPLYISRVTGGFRTPPEASDPAFLLARVRRFWFEIALSAGAGTIATIKTVADPDRILFGTDWPYAPETILTDTVAQLAANASLTPAERQEIASGNAHKLFG